MNCTAVVEGRKLSPSETISVNKRKRIATSNEREDLGFLYEEQLAAPKCRKSNNVSWWENMMAPKVSPKRFNTI